ncbi:helix-turn-helix domain-containing protein [Litoribacter ruber]|uniref:helix-turn-helix domain-containing protein n=1 Tax=Litoribacter ruber TaxID=702568 RepID=UPI001BD98112|nr:helix-turn-helix domain-containing protein [Litoribacter ruber]MBT0810889.1 helix-turn-helix domain-containing protein [Litoribacter ruber]
MLSFGETIRKLRQERNLSLRTVATTLGIDQAILSKVERGVRKATRDFVLKVAACYQVPKEDLLLTWMADKVVYELGNEDQALKVLQAAEERVAYMAFEKIDRNEILNKIKESISNFKQIEKAWIYGSFARKDDGPNSDVDIALQADSTFSYFDLMEVQHQLEECIKRKVDVGFIDSFKPCIFENVKSDLELIYER